MMLFVTSIFNGTLPGQSTECHGVILAGDLKDVGLAR